MKKNNSDEIIVRFDGVTKQYGDLVVLDKLNLEIKKKRNGVNYRPIWIRKNNSIKSSNDFRKN